MKSFFIGSINSRAIDIDTTATSKKTLPTQIYVEARRSRIHVDSIEANNLCARNMKLFVVAKMKLIDFIRRRL